MASPQAKCHFNDDSVGIEETDSVASIGKGSVVVTVTFWPDTVADMISEQRQALEDSSVELFSFKDFKQVLNELQGVSSLSSMHDYYEM